jgi:hypothetical protein
MLFPNKVLHNKRNTMLILKFIKLDIKNKKLNLK